MCLFFYQDPPVKFTHWAVTIIVTVPLSLLQLSAAQLDWPDLRFDEVASGLTNPTHIAHAGDGSGRMFVTEQAGRIRTLGDTNSHLTFLDIANRVRIVGSEGGLLSMAFSPSFATNRQFYINYTRQPDGASVVSRFRISPTNMNMADPTTEEVILTNAHPGDRHFGGQLAFGPDGYLYISRGDGGFPYFFTNAQTPANLLGKLLRIDVETHGAPYRVPASNPFVTNSAYRPEIWATGLRNPWRFSFDRKTGDLYIADAGEGEDGWEEINFQPHDSRGGANYGWPYHSGNYPDIIWSVRRDPVPVSLVDPPFERPVAALCWKSRTDWNAQALIGGFVHRAPASSPSSRLNGIYFCGDFRTRRIFGLQRDASAWQLELLASTTFAVSTFGEDEDGYVYLADYLQGKIYRLADSGIAAAPDFRPRTQWAPTDTIQIVTRAANGVTHYTLDGNDPTAADPVVASGAGIVITNGSTVKARTLAPGLGDSPVTAMTFRFFAAQPEMSPDGGGITNGTLVTLRCATEGATIEYTLVRFGQIFVYTGPFAITGNVSIDAWAYSDRFPRLPPLTRQFTLMSADTPEFTPVGQAITNGTRIQLSSKTPGASIYYTTNGQLSPTSSPLYVAPIEISPPVTILAQAFREDLRPSAVAQATYKLTDPPALNLSWSSGALIADWLTSAGVSYQLQSSEDLLSWGNVGPSVSGTGGRAFTTNDSSQLPSAHFFRILAH